MAMTKAEKKKAAARARRNRNKSVNVLTVVEGYVQSGIWTEKLFRTNPFEFVTGITDGTYKPGQDGGERMSIPEFITGFKGGSYADSPGQSITKNVTGSANADIMEVATSLIMPAIQTALVGVGFKFGKKMTTRPRAAINRGLKQFGLNDFIKI